MILPGEGKSMFLIGVFPSSFCTRYSGDSVAATPVLGDTTTRPRVAHLWSPSSPAPARCSPPWRFNVSIDAIEDEVDHDLTLDGPFAVDSFGLFDLTTDSEPDIPAPELELTDPDIN